MIHIVTLAFLRAEITELRASITQGVGELTAARHECGSRAAQLRTIQVEGDATGEVLHVFFPEACGRAVVALDGTVVTRFYAALVDVMTHEWTPAGWVAADEQPMYPTCAAPAFLKGA